jgi:hypothetical protein
VHGELASISKTQILWRLRHPPPWKFARALRLQWLWRGWSTNIERPWDGEETPYNKVDKPLFAASTMLTIGDGERASFRKSAWLTANNLVI